jgi:hypothetical protein
MNGIRSLRIDQNSRGESAAKKFRTDPDILVLLLHGLVASFIRESVLIIELASTVNAKTRA